MPIFLSSHPVTKVLAYGPELYLSLVVVIGVQIALDRITVQGKALKEHPKLIGRIFGLLTVAWGLYVLVAASYYFWSRFEYLGKTQGPFLLAGYLTWLAIAIWQVLIGLTASTWSPLGRRSRRALAQPDCFQLVKTFNASLICLIMLSPIILIPGNLTFTYLRVGVPVIGALFAFGLFFQTRRKPVSVVILALALPSTLVILIALIDMISMVYRLAGTQGFVLRWFDVVEWPIAAFVGFWLFWSVARSHSGKTHPTFRALAFRRLGIVSSALLFAIPGLRALECRSTVHDLREWGESYRKSRFESGFAKPYPMSDLDLPRASEGRQAWLWPLIDFAAIWEVRSNGVAQLQATRHVTKTDEAEVLSDEAALAKVASVRDEFQNDESEKILEFPIILAIENDAKWDSIVGFSKACSHHGISRVGIVVHAPPGPVVEPPAPSSADDTIESVSRDVSLSVFEKHLRISSKLEVDILCQCPAIENIFGGTMCGGFYNWIEFVVERLPSACAKCCCDVDIDSIKAMLYSFDFDHYMAIPVRLAAEGAREDLRLELAAGTPWSQAYRAVIELVTSNPDKAVRFYIEDSPAADVR